MDLHRIIDTLATARAVAKLYLHSSGYVPTPQDALVFQDIANDLPPLEDTVDQEITKQDQKDLLGALVSPCRRLPIEILSMIFVLALPDEWSRQYTGKREFNCMSVCVAWRDVALQTPQIWTALSFSAHANPLKNHTQALATELQKTGRLPLDVSIDVGRKAVIDDVWSEEAWALLCAQSHRWRHVSLSHIPVAAYDALATRKFTTLQALSICHYDRVTDIPLHAFERESTTVESLSITCWTSLHRTVDLPAMWPLTDLTIDLHYADPSVKLAPFQNAIFARSSTLRACKITAASLGFACEGEPRAFPCLEKLVLEHEATELCHIISCPNLQSLTMWSRDNPLVHRPWHALTSLLDQSSNCKMLLSLTLQELVLVGSEPLVRCLEQLPSLTDLDLEDDDYEEDRRLITPEVLLSLSRYSDHKDLLPNLQRLRLSLGLGIEEDEHDYDYPALVEAIIQSRRHAEMSNGTQLVALESLYAMSAYAELPWFPTRGSEAGGVVHGV
ncbi:hypothetical protein GGG16DRAFT_114828 [Schizophyllum commune]